MYFFIKLPANIRSSQETVVNQQDLDELSDFARRTARTAGALLRENLPRRHRVQHKGVVDLVTEVDRLSEEAIVKAIHAAYPDHPVLAEEGSGRAESGDLRWIVDPLDGTTN
jgi:myo-inositol-1(or 4)-monophosphatase